MEIHKELIHKKRLFRVKLYLKSLVLAISLIILHQLSLNYVNAHIVGQPPFFKVNGEYADYYPVPLESLEFYIPMDIAPQTYLLGQEISFEIDAIALQQPMEIVQNTLFEWDYGDGNTTSGLKNTHIYDKPGSYVIDVVAKYKQEEPMLIQSMLIHILPDESYSIPVSLPSVDGNIIDNPPSDILKTDLNAYEYDFDATNSTFQGNSPSYIWDFGDGTYSREGKVIHKFNNPSEYQQFIVLRVTDENGFYTDSYVEMVNTKGVSLSNSGESTLSGNLNEQNKKVNQIISVKSTFEGIKTKLTELKGNLYSNYEEITLTSRNYTAKIFDKNASPLIVILAIIFVFIAGGFHALTPGHGKSMMAAFLVGKGNSKIIDVLIIALSITLTHTIVIFALGFVFLYIDKTSSLPQVMPYFEKASAIIVVILGLNLIRNGTKNLINKKKIEKTIGNNDSEYDHHHMNFHYVKKDESDKKGNTHIRSFALGMGHGLGHSHKHGKDNEDSHEHNHDHENEQKHNHNQELEHDHDRNHETEHNHSHNHGHEHSHHHDHGHEHKHDHDHGHNHGLEHGHSHEIYLKVNKEGQVSKGSLFLAGFSGGIVPCVDALALLLVSVSASMVYWGLILVFIFSLGMALVIILLGMTLVFSKNKLNFDKKLGVASITILPILSGLFLILLAVKLFA